MMMDADRPSQPVIERLYLTFRLGNDRYALAAGEIVEVLRLQALKGIPQAPGWVAGILAYRGRLVPVVDLTARSVGRPASRRSGTRIVVVHYRPGTGGDSQLLGLVLERATSTVRLPDAGFEQPGIDCGDAAYLGPVHRTGDLVQEVAVAGLLPEDVRALLFPDQDSTARRERG